MATPYPRQRSNTWYLQRWPYRLFILRELSAVFFALYMGVLLVLAGRVHDGPSAFAQYVDALQSPLYVVFHIVALLFALLHSMTWFQAVPEGLPLRRGEQRVPPALVIAANYVAMAAVTALVLIFVLS